MKIKNNEIHLNNVEIRRYVRSQLATEVEHHVDNGSYWLREPVSVNALLDSRQQGLVDQYHPPEFTEDTYHKICEEVRRVAYKIRKGL